MAAKFSDIADGTLGHFWLQPPHDLDLATSRDGYVRIAENNVIQIATLTTGNQLERMMRGELEKLPNPAAAFGMTNATGVLFFDLYGVSENNNFGGARASTETLKYRSLAFKFDVSEIRSDRLSELSLHFPGVYFWSGLRLIEENMDIDAINRPSSYAAKILDIPRIKTQFTPTIELEITSTWSVTGHQDQRIMSTPMVLTSRSKKPVSWTKHVPQLLAVRDLLNLAYKGYIPASAGRVTLDYTDTYKPNARPEFWSSRFMVPPRSIESKDPAGIFPVFSVGDIGGIAGVKRWALLDRQHPRATGPLVNLYRFGRINVETRLIEIAAAMEYWTKIHQTLGRHWAQPLKLSKKKYEPLPNAMARKAGSAFEAFVGGDTLSWSTEFWNAYNNLKHAPNYQYDAGDIATLAATGELLLECSLLARCRGNQQIVKIVCESHHNNSLSIDVQRLLGKLPAK
ncbi:hypothetical protein [Gordonia sp. (in: high G+C Gram-positive bacteria)]|uniref:ApeA N-terminal domain 1-containing protein n=1 Tax=Gordonia sp. (in: high G+C Gram-positive bacteria) TaxID=84139 RepID=UPI003340815F